MKVCLISTPTVTEFNERQVAESDALRLIADHAPMGILSLAAMLENSGVTPSLLDLNGLYYEYSSGDRCSKGRGFCDHVVGQLESQSFDVFGFSTICSTYPLTLRLARGVKLTHPNARIVIGGPQASVADVDTLKAFPFVDFIVRGEAEVTFPLLLDAICTGDRGVQHIGGITYRRGTEIIRNPNAPVIEDLDALPMPAFHLYPHIKDCSYAPLEAGRGCPFACSFCSTNDFFRRRFRMKSPEVLVQQMQIMKETYGIGSFDLIHDMFTVDRRKVVSFCEAVEKSGDRFHWSCSARTDCIDDELISQMAHAGCLGVFYGVDTGSERLQEVINKRLNLPEAAERVKGTAKYGLDATVSLITGFPEETKDDLRLTVRFAAESLRYPKTEVQFHLLAPLAETPITTQYQDQLVYDDIFSDMSFQGWEQDPEDREMIVAHRDIFPNFYAVPTPWLDRHYLKEFREFFLKGAAKHRSLMLLLHLDSGDLLNVFDAWRGWSSEEPDSPDPLNRTRKYYISESFSRDLVSFVSSHYLGTLARYPHLVATLSGVETGLLSFSDRQCMAQPQCQRSTNGKSNVYGVESVPVPARAVKSVPVAANYKRLIRCLRRSERLDRIPAEKMVVLLRDSGDQVKILQLNQITYRLLCLCDGSRTIMEIARRFSAIEEIEGVSMIKAGLFGMTTLLQQGLIEIRGSAA